jgi:hypothetical protein
VPTTDIMRGSAGFTREQAMALRRPAWTGSGQSGHLEFYFDGSHFWRQRSGRLHELAPGRDVPLTGWLYSSECSCAACGASRRAPA